MLDLGKIVPGARVQGLDASGPVVIVGATPYGDTAVKIVFEVEAKVVAGASTRRSTLTPRPRAHGQR
jgi:hypothetical protein